MSDPENPRFSNDEGGNLVGDEATKIEQIMAENEEKIARIREVVAGNEAVRERLGITDDWDKLNIDGTPLDAEGLLRRIDDLDFAISEQERRAGEGHDEQLSRLYDMKPSEMLELGLTQDQVDAAYDAGKAGDFGTEAWISVLDKIGGETGAAGQGSKETVQAKLEQFGKKPEEEKKRLFGKFGKKAIMMVIVAGTLLAGAFTLLSANNTAAINVPGATPAATAGFEGGEAPAEGFEGLEFAGTDYRGNFLNEAGDGYNTEKQSEGERSWKYDISARVLDDLKVEDDELGARKEVFSQLVREPEFLAIFASRMGDGYRANMGLGDLSSVRDIETKLAGDEEALNKAEKALMYMIENNARGEFTRFTGRATNYYMRAKDETNIRNEAGSIEAARTATRNYENVEVFMVHFEDGSDVILDMDCLNVIVPVEEGTPGDKIEPGTPILEDEPDEPTPTPDEPDKPTPTPDKPTPTPELEEKDPEKIEENMQVGDESDNTVTEKPAGEETDKTEPNDNYNPDTNKSETTPAPTGNVDANQDKAEDKRPTQGDVVGQEEANRTEITTEDNSGVDENAERFNRQFGGGQ